MDGFGFHQAGFQIADDILGFTADAAVAGAQAHLMDGTVTLPLALALARDESTKNSGGGPGEADIEDICKRVAATGAIDDAGEEALSQVTLATAELGRASGEIDPAPLALVAGMAVDRKA
jgi:geranylgeranyl pyrophosphate synthase